MPMLNIIIKTIIIYIVLFLAMRVMGQRQSGQLQPYELVITLIIAEVASTPMDNPGIPLFYGLVPAATLILLYSPFSASKAGACARLSAARPAFSSIMGKCSTERLSASATT